MFETHFIFLSLRRDEMNQAVAVMTYVVFPWSANGNIFVNGVNVAPGGRAIFQSESKLTLVFFNLYEMD